MSVTFAFYVGRGTRADWMIRAATGYPESHVEMLSVSRVKQANLCISASKRDGRKVRQTTIEWNPDNWVFVEVPDLHGGDCLVRAMNELGAPYDTLGAAMSITGRGIGGKGRWFCSELMAHAAGLEDPHRYTPGLLKEVLLDMGGNIITI